MEITNVMEYEKIAKEKLPKMVYDYYASGAEDQWTLQENRNAFSRILFRPRILIDVSEIDVSTTVLGFNISMPIMIAPTAMQKMAHPDGELATARATSAAGTIMTLSSWATCSVEEVASTGPGIRFFQLYVYKDKEKKEDREKKSKDRSKEKHKERKEKKEKHKDRKDKEKDKEKNKPLEEKKAEVLTNTGHRETLVTNTVQNSSNGESKYVQELARRIRYEEEATGSQSAQKITKKGVSGKSFENSSFCPVQETNHRENDDKRISTQKNFAVAKNSENAVARVSFGADQKRPEAMGKPMENRDQWRHTESPEKSHRNESATKSDKPRDKEGVKKNEAKDKAINKEKKTESINKTHQEKPKLIEGPNLEERGNYSLDIRNGRPPDISRASVKNLIAEGNLGKRKDLDTNGLLYDNGTTPNKLHRHSASVSSMENGRTFGAYRTSPIPASKVQGTTCKPGVKELKVNGFVVPGEKQKVCPMNPLTATMKVKVKENGEASAKPPHPDLKYLNQILNVPKRELFLEVDYDEEWLYGPLGVKLKKARTDFPDSGESLQVWNQAFRIESADISALPYVVPF